MKIGKGRIAVFIVVALLFGALVYGFLPKPVPVETAAVRRGPLQVAVRDDGRTRIKERYVVSAPISGRLMRVALKPGHRVEAGKTVVAAIEPPDPQLLDPRALAGAEARVRAAEAARRQAQALLDRALANYDFTETELERTRRLFETGDLSRQELDRAELAVRTAREELNSARFGLLVAEFELEQAEAALLQSQPEGRVDSRFEIRSPITGKVLRVYQESAAVVTMGAPLLELGDPENLEIEIDVLSSDAVNIQPGAPVWLEYWGGPEPLQAQVRLIEPAGFTKISALGVEEQRVWVIADFVSPQEQWRNLGDGYRVEARVVTWERGDVLKVPSAALFRRAEEWGVFAVESGRAALKTARIGQRNEHEAEVLGGLTENDLVILHPGDRIHEGVAVTSRK